jgi:Doublecortin
LPKSSKLDEKFQSWLWKAPTVSTTYPFRQISRSPTQDDDFNSTEVAARSQQLVSIDVADDDDDDDDNDDDDEAAYLRQQKKTNNNKHEQQQQPAVIEMMSNDQGQGADANLAIEDSRSSRSIKTPPTGSLQSLTQVNGGGGHPNNNQSPPIHSNGIINNNNHNFINNFNYSHNKSKTNKSFHNNPSSNQINNNYTNNNLLSVSNGQKLNANNFLDSDDYDDDQDPDEDFVTLGGGGGAGGANRAGVIGSNHPPERGFWGSSNMRATNSRAPSPAGQLDNYSEQSAPPARGMMQRSKSRGEIMPDGMGGGGIPAMGPAASSRYSNLGFWKARRVLFYRNGDPYFPGVELRFKPGRDINSMESLLDKISSRMDLPRGARYIFSMDGDRKYTLDELEDGASYVVSSFKVFKVSPHFVIQPPFSAKAHVELIEIDTINLICLGTGQKAKRKSKNGYSNDL